MIGRFRHHSYVMHQHATLHAKRHRERRKRLLYAATLLLMAAVLITPIFSIASAIFAPATDAWRHLVSTRLPDYIGQSLQLVLLVACLAGSMGAVSAWLVTQYEFSGRRAVEWLLVLPLAAPAYVIAYAYTDFFQTSGPFQVWLRGVTGWQVREYWFPELRSLPGAALMLACTLYPYVYLLCRAAFVEQSKSLTETARIFGLTRWQAFRRVSLPLARPALAGGLALVAMETLADFGTVSYFSVQTFTTGIFRAWHAFGDLAAASKLAAMLLVVVLVVYAIERHARRHARYFSGQDVGPRTLLRLTGWRSALALVACATPVVLGFGLPALLLARLALDFDAAQATSRVLAAAANSTLMALATASLAVTIALILGYASRGRAMRLVEPAKRLATLGYAVPGAVIAVGVLAPIGWIDRHLASQQLILTGSVAALIYAYVVRFLAVAQESMDAGIARVTPNMEDAARSLGVTLFARLTRVHLPLVRQSALTAMLLVFIDVMKELPATFVLRPFNFETLAVQIYNFASDERLPEAAAGSLTLIALGLIPVALIARGLTSRSGR